MNGLTRYFYFRKDGTRQSQIVGCCAYRQLGDTIEYAVSALNPLDRFNRPIARQLAKERLNRKKAYIAPTVSNTFWNRLKLKLRLMRQSWRVTHPLFEVRRVIEGNAPWRDILKDVASLTAVECPTNLKRAAKKMLRNAIQKHESNLLPLMIQEPIEQNHIKSVA